MTRWWPVLLAATCLGLTEACRTADQAGQPEHDRVRAIAMPYITLMPFYIAAEEGYFADEGLDVELIRVARNQDIMAALATGEVDVAGGMLTVNELNLALGGARVRMIASLGELRPEACRLGAVMVRRDLVGTGVLEDPEAIRDLRFDVDQVIPIGYWADLFLRRFGLDIDDVTVVNMPSPATIEAMRTGALDVTVEGEPFVTMLESSGAAAVWERADAIVPNFVMAMMMYGPTLLDERPEVGERFAVAILRAIRQFMQGKTARNLAIVERGTGLPSDVVASSCWPVVGDNARLDPLALRGYQEWSVERGLVDRVLEDEELFEPRFMEQAAARLAKDE